MRKKNVAIVLAAGSGKRMGSEEAKQFLPINKIPMLAYTLRAFERSGVIDEIILVTKKEDICRCYDDIIDIYGFTKVSKVIAGGAERYDSSYCGIVAAGKETGYVFIHDGARPCVDENVIVSAYEIAKAYDACIAAVPSKDTIRRVRGDHTRAGVILDRNEIWQVQTPQVFEYRLVREAYERFFKQGAGNVTDDAAVVERTMEHPIMISQGSYRNIKVTTPEDLIMAQALLTQGA